MQVIDDAESVVFVELSAFMDEAEPYTGNFVVRDLLDNLPEQVNFVSKLFII